MSQLILWGDVRGTMTAQVLIGKSHPYDGGIRPEWMVQLSENIRPHLILHNNINFLNKSDKRPSFYEWTPSIERGVEDVLSMIALHVVEHRPLVDKMVREYSDILENRVEVYGIPNAVREVLYKGIREVGAWPKLAISVYFNCYLERRFSLLEKLNFDFDLCKSVRVRKRGGCKLVKKC